MITAVDASVLLDVLASSSKEIQIAQSALRQAESAGAIITSVVAYAEVAAQFTSKVRAKEFFDLLSCKIEALDENAAFLGGQFFDEYKQRGGKRTRVSRRLPHCRPRAIERRPHPDPRHAILRAKLSAP